MPKKRKKILRILLILALILAGWISWSFHSVPARRAQRDFPAPTSRYNLGKVLVLYYSLGGNTAEVAGRIRDMTGGTLVEIETEKHYPSVPALYLVAGYELKSRNYPDLKKSVDNFSPYDIIFVGSPVWWFTVSTPMLSFLSTADFKGKKVVPFTTEEGNYGEYFVRFGQEARNANVLEGMSFRSVSKTDISILDQKISAWLGTLMR